MFQAEMWQENSNTALKSIFPCSKYQHKQIKILLDEE